MADQPPCYPPTDPPTLETPDHALCAPGSHTYDWRVAVGCMTRAQVNARAVWRAAYVAWRAAFMRGCRGSDDEKAPVF